MHGNLGNVRVIDNLHSNNIEQPREHDMEELSEGKHNRRNEKRGVGNEGAGG